MGAPVDQSCRSVLADLDRTGDLLVVDQPVAAEYETAAVFSLVDARAAVRLNKVGATGIPVFGGILADRERIARVLGVPVAEIQQKLLDAIASPVEPVMVADAPVQDIVINDNILASLPIPTFFPRETGPYITAGMIVARDPETGLGNVSYARIKVLGPDEALIGIAPNHHLSIMARKAAAKGQSLPFAVVLGAHPAIQMAACLYLGLGDDEMHCAGALLNDPVRLVQCKTIDLAVPAEAEIVLEGHIHADDIIIEGLVSEYHGMYEDYGTGVRLSFTALTRRHDAMLQIVQPGYHQEHLVMAAIPIAAGLRAALKESVRNVTEVAVTLSGSGRTNVVVQIDKPRPGQARRAMMACWGAVSIVKNVTIVDTDVDPWDEMAVERAKMARMRAERDILIVPNMQTDRSEPQEDGGMTTKVGYDATRKEGDRKEGFEPAVPPADAMARMRSMLEHHHPEFL
ncbi:MAG: UbiD family decarboxylase [Devosia sp.]